MCSFHKDEKGVCPYLTQAENDEGDAVWKEDEILSTDLKNMAGFGKNKEKNYSGIVTGLQMQLYLVITDFRRRVNKKGNEYGMAVSIMFPPETVWGYDLVTSAYDEAPRQSWERIYNHVAKNYPNADETDIVRLIGKKPKV